MPWNPPGAAPRELDKLASFVDLQFAELSQVLAQEHKPLIAIWAEENAALAAATYEWAFGDGANAASGLGIVIPFRCGLVAMSLSLAGAAARAKVEIERDGTLESDYAIDLTASNQGYVEFYDPLTFHPGSVLNFRTVTQSGTAASNQVCAWLQLE